jgi:hypothetical protein
VHRSMEAEVAAVWQAVDRGVGWEKLPFPTFAPLQAVREDRLLRKQSCSCVSIYSW